MNRLKCILLNTQDLFIFMDKYNNNIKIEDLTEHKWQLLSSSLFANKSLNKVLKMAEFLLLEDPDIILLTEVGGHESLDNFNNHFLLGKYNIHFTPSNSDRGIDLAFMSKKDLPFESVFTHYMNFPLLKGGKFARGVLQLHLETENKDIFFLLTHLKSKLNLKGGDFEGRSQREKEVKGLVKIYRNLQQCHPNAFIYLCGDLNGIIFEQETEEELKPLSIELGLVDLVQTKTQDIQECWTYVFYDRQSNAQKMQLDYVLCSVKDAQLVNLDLCEVYRYPEFGKQAPSDRFYRDQLFSDHYPYIFQLKL